MAWKDVKARFLGLFRNAGGNSTRRPDGGTSCYRPVQRRNRQEENLAREKAAEYAAGQFQAPVIHTGFTGMNPPMTGAVPLQSTHVGDSFGGGTAQAARQEYRANFPGRGGAGFQPGGYSGGETPVPENISYMPGACMPDAGSSYTHVEHIMAITSLQSCYEAIECMKNGETLVVTLDVLGSDGESMRCQDMLAGAAFTLQCTVRNLTAAGVIVIAPPGVKILPEQRSRRYESPADYTPQVQPWNGEEDLPRERRASRNPLGWGNAPEGEAFNPYTGSMPAAAGAYGVYGGY